jgi:DNA repair exonuclease SbcCD ATPase subunit
MNLSQVRRFAIRRAFSVMILVLTIPAGALGQTASSDSQTLQALLTEVRELRQDLRVSLVRVQSAQILLSRLQIQEMDVTRASQQLDEARSKLAEVQVVRKSEESQIKHWEEMPAAGESAEQIQETIDAAKADLEASVSVEQQRQATKTEAEQQLQTGQEKLNKLEAQLDEIVKTLSDPGEQSGRVQR